MSDEAPALLLHALEHMLRDRDRGRLLDLESYRKLYPGAAETLAEHYAGVAAADAPEPEPALRRLGRYRLVEELGRGGQGVVFRAVDDELGRTVAIKLLTGVNALGDDALRRFLREAQLASRLDHPGICPVHEYGQDDGLPFLVMSHVEGESLAHQLARPGATPPASREEIAAVLEVFERAARALHAAHEDGVVHRDVKPANLMIRPNGQPVLLDFGLARLLEEKGMTITRSGQVQGTPAYMAPEQIEPELAPVDQRTDVYSLGISLFEALTHALPFSATTRDGLYRQILDQPLPSPRSLNPKLPADLDAILETALHKRPGDRYVTAASFADDLGRARRCEPIAARPTTGVQKLGKWAARNPRWVASLGVLMVLLAVVSAAASWLAVETEAALADAEILADAQRLDVLLDRAENDLWPTLPDELPAFEAWFAGIDRLLGRQETLKAALQTLRARALPRSAADRAADREHYAEAHASLEHTEHQLAQLTGQPAKRAELEDYVRRARAYVSRRFTWSFADPEQRLRHDVLRDLCRRLSNIQVPAGQYRVTVADVRARRDMARRLGERVAGEDAALWQRCVEDVGRPDSVYRGLAVVPTAGLVPLGVDRNSGLWEFWHPASGARPAWDGKAGERGAVRLEAASGAEGLVLVLLPGGTFDMGTHRAEAGNPQASEADAQAKADEAPRHAVTLGAFLISKYEVTRAQWKRLWYALPPEMVRPGEKREGQGRRPVTHVDWNRCLATCGRWGLQLPTEAQWEYACRAGTTTPYSTGSAPGSLRGAANVADGRTPGATGVGPKSPIIDHFTADAPVGSLIANPWGLHDLHGNVAEWCRDGYTPYSAWEHRADDGLRGPEVGWSARVVRPGSFAEPAASARSSARHFQPPEFTGADTGFRPAASVPARR